MDAEGIVPEPTDEQRRAWEALCATVSDIMNVHTRPFVTPLVHDVPGEPLRIGGGTYLDLGDGTEPRTTVLTCEHVARFQPQLHQPNGCMTLLPLPGQLYADRDLTIDAATILIANASCAQLAHAATPLTTDRLADRQAPVSGEVFFFRGLTGENSYVSGGDLDAVYTGYVSQERPGTGDDQIFEIEWNPLGPRSRRGRTLRRPRGSDTTMRMATAARSSGTRALSRWDATSTDGGRPTPS